MRILYYSFTLTVLIGFVCGCAVTRPSARVEARLAAPSTEPERVYLGLSNGVSNFKLEDVACDLLVVDCFDMYCHVCQSGAKRVNRLYSLIQERGLGQRVKMIGLGVGDTPLETTTYRDKFKVPFPVFPDRRAAVARSLGPLRVPNVIVLRKRGDHLIPIYSNPGELREPEQFLTHLETSLDGKIPAAWAKPIVSTQATCIPGSGSCRLPAVLDTEPSAGSRCPVFH